MRTLIVNGILCCLAVATLAIDEHRPKKKVEERGKRNLEYQVSHHYSALPSYRLERRIASLGGQYQNPQYYPRYHKDPQSEDLLTENNQIQDNIDRYGYQKPHIIERPVYIKEPEPIIEIIIKESNVSLPAPPPPPPPPKKKKEQVQVFYVKYKKNPHSSGKDSIIYDKPIPAISPHIPDDEPIEEPAPYYPEHVTAPPPPSTTLRTIIKPDSEYYHSPSGVKVTFGKEGFDYDKRSSKIEDYAPTPIKSPAPQGRQLTSFSNTYFKSPSPTNFQSLPPGFSSNVRQPQTYRTIPPTSSNYKPFGRQTAPSSITPPQNYPFQSSPSAPFSSFSQPSPPQFGHSVSHPPPPRFQSASKPSLPQIRQPVPYKPFDNLRPQQSFAQTPAQRPPIQFRPETHFPIQQQLPLQDDIRNFNSPRYQLNSGEVQTRQPIPQQYQKLPNQAQPSFRPPQTQPQFSPKFQQPDFQHNFNRPQITIQQPQQQPFQQQSIAPAPPSSHFQQPQLNIAQQFRQTPQQINPQQHQQQINPQQHQQQINQQHQQHTNPPQHQQHSNPQQQNFQSQLLSQQHQQQGFLSQQPLSQNDHLKNLQSAQNILPPGGQLIPSVSKYESHITSVEPTVSVQGLSPQQYQQKIIQQFNQNSLSQEQTSQELLNRQQTRSHEASKEILTRQQTSSQYTNQFAHHQQNSLPQYNTQDSLARQQSLLRQQNEDLLKRQQSNVEQQKKLLQDIQIERERQNSIQHYFSKPNSGDVGPQQNAGDSQKKLYEEIERQRYQQEQLRQFYQQNPDIKHSAVGMYLPLKINGTQFPIPDVPELKGKRISSVVVLAPVNFDFSAERKTREATGDSVPSDMDLIEGTALKELLLNPSMDNFRRFLENENKTTSAKQSVILLIAE
uniref:Mediator of RNA polymerase II transcription subunit 12 n=1 Tax=Diabrotica virgifera virgifera TaxID=50390 RepID=A0A6P7FY76_DIAVI